MYCSLMMCSSPAIGSKASTAAYTRHALCMHYLVYMHVMHVYTYTDANIYTSYFRVAIVWATVLMDSVSGFAIFHLADKITSVILIHYAVCSEWHI